MKKVSIIFLLTAMIASLFVACNNEAPVSNFNQDKTAQVSVIADMEKALQATGNDESYAVEDLYWFYTATKTSGAFVTGQKLQFTPVKGTAENPEKGLVNSSLGSYSLGGWTFVFKGYHDIPEEFNYNHFEEDLDAAYYAINQVVLTGDLSLTVELCESEGMPEAGFTVSGISISATDLYNPAGCNLYIIEGTQMPQAFDPEASIISPIQGVYDSQAGTVTFSSPSLKGMAVGNHNLLFVVTSSDAAHHGNVVGYEPLALLVKKGVQQVVSGTIDMDNDLSDISVIAYISTIQTGVSFEDALADGHLNATIETAAVEGNEKSTNLSFDLENATPEAEEKLLEVAAIKATVHTASSASHAGEQGAYLISNSGNTGVAAIDLSLLDNGGDEVDLESSDGISIHVSTYIEPGLGDNNVIVTYEGTTSGISNVSYDSATGLLEFTTTHFSAFLAELQGCLLTDDGDLYTLDGFRTAVNGGNTFSGKTVRLLKNLDLSASAWTPIGDGYRGSGSVIVGKKFSGTFDGQGHTIKGLHDGENYAPAASTDGEYNYGFFGNVENAAFRNIRFTEVEILSGNTSYSADAVGALIGYSRGSLTVQNIRVNGLISGQSAAGIVGRAYGMDEDAEILISNCHNDAMITATTPDENNQSYTARAAGIVAFLSSANFGGADTTSASVIDCVNNGTLMADGPKPIIAGILNYGYARMANNNQTNVIDHYEFQGNLNNGIMVASDAAYWMAYIACSCSDDIKAGDYIDFADNTIGADAQAWKNGEEATDVLYVTATQAGSAGTGVEFNGLEGTYPNVQ